MIREEGAVLPQGELKGSLGVVGAVQLSLLSISSEVVVCGGG
jgi:hypothetical protein